MGGSIRFQIVLRTLVLAVLLGALLVGLQSVGPSLGIGRQAGQWIWAGAGLSLTLALFLPLLHRAGVSPGRVTTFTVILLTFAVGAYLYVDRIMLPEAVARATAARPK